MPPELKINQGSPTSAAAEAKVTVHIAGTPTRNEYEQEPNSLCPGTFPIEKAHRGVLSLNSVRPPGAESPLVLGYNEDAANPPLSGSTSSSADFEDDDYHDDFYDDNIVEEDSKSAMTSSGQKRHRDEEDEVPSQQQLQAQRLKQIAAHQQKVNMWVKQLADAELANAERAAKLAAAVKDVEEKAALIEELKVAHSNEVERLKNELAKVKEDQGKKFTKLAKDVEVIFLQAREE